MEKNVSSLPVENDLHIAKHLEPEQLPALIRPLMNLAQSDAEKDMLLLSLLTAAGACMPNLYFRYGIAGKRYYPNLQLFIVGSAACGKGIANLALELVRPVHDQAPLIIPGDSTYPAFYQALARQGGHGYIHESEGSVITDIWRSSTANYNTALRKAAEHEPISRARCKAHSVIEDPQLSMVLTGTFSQYRALVPSIENGYFSRLLTLIVSDVHPFSAGYVQSAEHSRDVLRPAAEHLYRLYEHLFFSEPREFRLTAEQRDRLGHHLQSAYPTLIRLLGEDFHSVILRMAVHIERIAMILSAMRSRMSECYSDAMNKALICSDGDYQIAELIGNKLILHMAQAYQMIKGTEELSLPTVKPLDQKQILLSLLPEEFESKQLIDEAKAQGISRRTAFNWSEEWQELGSIVKIRHGVFRKLLASA
ncbi:MAG: DUF3987 domain-containing protein [Paludibacteraceae bacterium]|nr:DUF3987 domain-containing protein [Paludibacteraceae bacterium]